MCYCTLQLDVTSRSGYATGVYSCLAEMTHVTTLQLNGKQQKWEILLPALDKAFILAYTVSGLQPIRSD